MPIGKGIGPICALVNIKHSIQVELCDSDEPIYYMVDPPQTKMIIVVIGVS